MNEMWQACIEPIKKEVTPDQYERLVAPLHIVEVEGAIKLLAPNKYVVQEMEDDTDGDEAVFKKLERIVAEKSGCGLTLGVGSRDRAPPKRAGDTGTYMTGKARAKAQDENRVAEPFLPMTGNGINMTFDNFVEGDSNQLASTAARMVSENVGDNSYNPLLLYGGVGLGKTHLMYAIGNAIAENHPRLKTLCLSAQQFREEVVNAISNNAMDHFKAKYRSADVLLMDDIQLIAQGEKTQEEFFHIFNHLQSQGQQIVLTSDKHPKDLGLQKRVESRLVWGMTAPLEPPELETRVAILMKKAELLGESLTSDSARFIARRIKTNVRELEGALKRVLARSKMLGGPIDKEMIKDSLKDIFAIQDRHISIENIQKVVAEYYKLRIADLLSKSRTKKMVTPRHVAMALARELTNHSLPEIGDAFGGRDHSTIIHATKKVEELRETDRDVAQDYRKLLQLLTI